VAEDWIEDPASRINDVLDREEVRIARLFRAAIINLKDDIDLDEIAALLEAGRLEDAIDLLKHAAEELGSASNLSFVTSGQSTAQFLTNAAVGRIVFDQVNTLAVAAMQANRLELIREFTNEQRSATSFALINAVEAGTNPRAAARTFRDSIGLTENGWKAIQTYRTSLERVGRDENMSTAALTHAVRDRRSDSVIRRAIRTNKPLDPDWIEKRVQFKINKAIANRAETIGRTEALRAVHQGNEEAYRQAIESGTINEEDLIRSWVTRLDGRERETHELLNGQKRNWGKPWTTRNGTLRYPGDPRAPAKETVCCRCAIATRIRLR
jgi:hypothetical protein